MLTYAGRRERENLSKGISMFSRGERKSWGFGAELLKRPRKGSTSVMRKERRDSAAPCSVCGGAWNHQNTSDCTRGCSVSSFIPVQNVQNKNNRNKSGREDTLFFCLERSVARRNRSVTCEAVSGLGREFESRNPTARENKPELRSDSDKFLRAVAHPNSYLFSNQNQTPNEIYNFTSLIFADLLTGEWD